MAPAPLKLTHADYLQLPEDGRRHELLDGEHFVTPSPRVGHQRVSHALGYLLTGFVRDNDLGEVFAAPLDVILSDHDVVQPDLLFVSRDRRQVVQDWIRGAPDLVVEIHSDSTRQRDRGLKARVYRSRGVREYWLVDPDARSVEVRRFAADGSTRIDRLDARGTLESPLLPGLTIRVAEIFG